MKEYKNCNQKIKLVMKLRDITSYMAALFWTFGIRS